MTPHQHSLAEQALLSQDFETFWKPFVAQLESGFLTTMVRGFALRDTAWVQKNFGSRVPQEHDVVSHFERLKDAPKIFWKAFLHALLEQEETVLYAMHHQQRTDQISPAWHNALVPLLELLPQEFFEGIIPPSPSDLSAWEDTLRFFEVDPDKAESIKGKMLEDKTYRQNLISGMQFYFGMRLSHTVLEQAADIRDLQRGLVQKDDEITKLRFQKKQKTSTATAPDPQTQQELEQAKQQVRQLETAQKSDAQARQALEKQLLERDKQLKKLESDLADSNARNEKNVERIRVLEERQTSLNTDIRQAREQVVGLQQELEQHKRDKEALEFQLENTQRPPKGVAIEPVALLGETPEFNLSWARRIIALEEQVRRMLETPAPSRAATPVVLRPLAEHLDELPEEPEQNQAFEPRELHIEGVHRIQQRAQDMIDSLEYYQQHQQFEYLTYENQFDERQRQILEQGTDFELVKLAYKARVAAAQALFDAQFEDISPKTLAAIGKALAPAYLWARFADRDQRFLTGQLRQLCDTTGFSMPTLSYANLGELHEAIGLLETQHNQTPEALWQALAESVAAYKENQTSKEDVFALLYQLLDDQQIPNSDKWQGWRAHLLDVFAPADVPKRIKRHLFLAQNEKTVSEPLESPELTKIRPLTQNKKIVLLGGIPYDYARERIRAAFAAEEVIWRETRVHASLEGLKHDIQQRDVVLVVLLIQLAGHAFESLKWIAEDNEAIFIRHHRNGYHPNSLALSILEQAGKRLGV